MYYSGVRFLVLGLHGARNKIINDFFSFKNLINAQVLIDV